MRLIPPTIAESTQSGGERAVFDALAAALRALGDGGWDQAHSAGLLCLERVWGGALGRLGLQLQARGIQGPTLLVADRGVARIDADERVGDHGGGGGAREPLAVGGNDVPGRPR